MIAFRSRLQRAMAQLLIGFIVLAHAWMMVPARAYAAPSTTIVINEIQLAQSGSGNTTQEFVELYNTSATDINISGWTLKKYPASGLSAQNLAVFPAGTMLNANDYLLVAHPDYISLSPTPDVTYTTGASLANDNSVALLDGTTVIDLVRLGSASVPDGLVGEEDATVNPSPDKSVSRNASHADTDNNMADFVELGVPTPQASKPNTPLLNPVIPGDQSLTISWQPVVNASLGYEVFSKPDGASAFMSEGLTLNTDLTIFGLTNGITYTIQVVAKNQNGNSAPATQVGVPGDTVFVSIVYSQNSNVGTHFGPGEVTARVTPDHVSDLDATDAPTITFNRPNLPAIVLPLTQEVATGDWLATADMVKAASATQDGTIAVSVQSQVPGKTVTIDVGQSFTVDTFAAAPTVMMTSRCSGNQDSFVATTSDSDVQHIYIYQAASVDLPNLVAVASVTNGQTGEVFIGDNVLGSLYLVAQDTTGNRSAVTHVVNDISSPTPELQLEATDGKIIASWPSIADATQYVLRWRPLGDLTWHEMTITGTRHEISVANDREYEVSVASRDGACNQSAFVTRAATARSAAFLSDGARGGLGREAEILASTVWIAEEKDGAVKPPSPFTVEEDRDQNGVKDAEEDKNGNGVPDGEEQPDGQNGEEEEEEENGGGLGDLLRDRSRLIIAIAILLIVAGTALAAYSWYQGGEGPEGGEPKPEPTEPEPDKGKAAPSEKPKRGRPKRKTRW